MARELNGWLAQTSRDLARYGLPLATVHLDDPDPLADLRAAFDDGCIGLKVHEDVQRLAIDDPRFAPLFEEIAERSGFVLAHIGPIPWSTDTRNGPARVAAVLTRHPRLRLVVAHLGVPETLRYFELARRYPNLFIDTTMALSSPDLATTATSAQIEAASGSIVYGSDFPNIPYSYAADQAAVAGLGLSARARHAILVANAQRLSPALVG
jgi:predicted TIM-barrel fold metal-dependent hydrolase